MEWTKEQAKAISLRDKNLLVSAAAGSGKTAVLIERIKTLILKEGASVDQFLIVTFTNAASADMRAKLVSAINKHITEHPEDARMMKKQLNLIYRANISTFHAFSLEVIRRYFYIIDVEPNFKICDEAEAAILLGESMDRLFELQFENSSPEFIGFLKRYSGSKNEKKIREMIMDVYKNVSSVPYPDEWYDTFVEGRAALASGDVQMAEKEFCQSSAFVFMLADIERNLDFAIKGFNILKDFLEDKDIDSIAEKAALEIANTEELKAILKKRGFEAFVEALTSQSTVRYVAAKAEKEDYEEVKEQVQKLRKQASDRLTKIKKIYGTQSIQQNVQDMIATYPYEKMLVTLVKEFAELYGEAKAEKNLIDFSDIEHYALRILSNEAVAQEYRDKFKYIFVDEYQDSNGIQEALLSCIKRENNLFMVGDVKQSIYKFRLAEPELFMKRYADYKDMSSGSHENIDMNQNFRSTKPVIDTVNNVFRSIMPEYDEKAELHLGVDYSPKYLHASELYLAAVLNDTDDEGEMFELEKAEYEAIAAAQIILKAIKEKNIVRKLPVLDDEGNFVCDENGEPELIETLQKLQFRDIAILMRSTRSAASKYQKILMEYGIPVYIEDSDGYYDTLEIDIFVNLLRVIDNKRQDVALISVLYSMIFDFTVEELSRIRLACRKEAFYSAFLSYSENGSDEVLVQKCRSTLQRIEDWRRKSVNMPLDEFLWNVMWETGYYTYTGALPAGEQRQANLRALVDRAIQFQGSHMNGIYSFIQYIDSVKSRGALASQVSLSGENDNVVRMMTIHKSKGLEFPMVIVAGLSQRFNGKTNKKGICVHKDMGIALRRVEYEGHWYKTTLLQSIIERKKQHEEREEEVRVLYVAMTRAMDYLVMLGTEKVEDASLMDFVFDAGGDADVDAAGCFLDMIRPSMPVNGVFLHDRLIREDISDGNDVTGLEQKVEQPCESIAGMVINGTWEKPDSRMQQAINKKLDYVYVADKDRPAKSKYTVTEINEASGTHKQYETRLAVPAFMQEQTVLTAGEKGTAMHTAAEKLDFKLCLTPDSCDEHILKRKLEAYKEKLVNDMILLPVEAEAVSVDALKNLLLSDIGKRIAASQNVRRELPFTMKHIYEGNEVMVQGVIDCCFEEDGKYVIVDYKTNFMKDDSTEEIDRLKDTYTRQLELYKKALESICHVQVKEAYLYLFDISREVKVL